jgi:putative lipoprotein
MTRSRGLAFALAVGLAVPGSAEAAPAVDPWWGPDKALHLGVSALISGAGYGVAAAVTDSRPLRLLVASGAGLLAGTLKELLDLAGLGTPSWKDFTWDVIGTLSGAFVALLLDVLVFRPLLEPLPQPG